MKRAKLRILYEETGIGSFNFQVVFRNFANSGRKPHITCMETCTISMQNQLTSRTARTIPVINLISPGKIRIIPGIISISRMEQNSSTNNAVTNNEEAKNWLPVIALALSAFVFNTSEFIPIGLLTDIGNDFRISEAETGRMITIYAWVVAIMSLPLMLAASKVENKRLLTIITSVFIASHVLSAIAPSFNMLVMSRIGVACSHAIFWSIVSPIAVRVAPHGKRATALGMIISGSSIAMIVGLPLGRVIGLYAGWRTTFLIIGIVATAMLLFLLLVFPRVPSRDKNAFKALPSLLTNKTLLGVYTLTAIFVVGHYTAYSYIEPFLQQVANLSDAWITAALVLFGLVGIGGSVLYSKFYESRPNLFVIAAVGGVTLLLFMLRPMAFSLPTAILQCIFWGLSITLYNLVFQSKIIQLEPNATAIAMSIFSGIYNIGIGGGALVGGMICTDLSIGDVGYIGGVVATIALVYCITYLLPRFRRMA